MTGNWIRGTTINKLTADGTPNWPATWYVPTIITAAVLLVFFFMFREKKKNLAS